MQNFDTELDTLQVTRRRVVVPVVQPVIVPTATVTVVDRDIDPVSAPLPTPVIPVDPGTIVVPTASTVPTIQARSDLLTDAADWSWQQLRDYVVAQIIDRHGPFPRDAVKEAGVFKGFSARWGRQAGPIAVVAFETFHGVWRSAPIAITRFAKGSDPFFAAVIAARL